MVHQHAQVRVAVQRGPLEHLQIAVGVAESRDRFAADVFFDADGLFTLIGNDVDLRKPQQNGLAVAQFVISF